MKTFWGYHLILDCSNCKHEAIINGDTIRKFSEELVKRIKMVAYGAPIIEHFAKHDPSRAGYSLVQLIETSNISAHFVDCDNAIYLDVFSCLAFDIGVVQACVEEFFAPEAMKVTYLTRQA